MRKHLVVLVRQARGKGLAPWAQLPGGVLVLTAWRLWMRVTRTQLHPRGPILLGLHCGQGCSQANTGSLNVLCPGEERLRSPAGPRAGPSLEGQ